MNVEAKMSTNPKAASHRMFRYGVLYDVRTVLSEFNVIESVFTDLGTAESESTGIIVGAGVMTGSFVCINSFAAGRNRVSPVSAGSCSL